MNAEAPTTYVPSQRGEAILIADDLPSIFSIAIVAAVVSDVLHEGVGHGLTALLTGASSGLLTTVAWSSQFDSRLVEAGGTLANLAAGLVAWLILRGWRRASASSRYFLLVCAAFNWLSGTGYFLFSGISGFGDWAVVIRGLQPHWVWRTLLVITGMAGYYAAARLIGFGLVRYVGIPRDQQRLRRFTLVPYCAAIVVLGAGALLNPLGIQLLWQSALSASAGGHSGLLWLQYSISRAVKPESPSESLRRNYAWIIAAVFLGLLFVVVLGRGVTLSR